MQFLLVLLFACVSLASTALVDLNLRLPTSLAVEPSAATTTATTTTTGNVYVLVRPHKNGVSTANPALEITFLQWQRHRSWLARLLRPSTWFRSHRECRLVVRRQGTLIYTAAAVGSSDPAAVQRDDFVAQVRLGKGAWIRSPEAWDRVYAAHAVVPSNSPAKLAVRLRGQETIRYALERMEIPGSLPFPAAFHDQPDSWILAVATLLLPTRMMVGSLKQSLLDAFDEKVPLLLDIDTWKQVQFSVELYRMPFGRRPRATLLVPYQVQPPEIQQEDGQQQEDFLTGNEFSSTRATKHPHASSSSTSSNDSLQTSRTTATSSFTFPENMGRSVVLHEERLTPANLPRLDELALEPVSITEDARALVFRVNPAVLQHSANIIHAGQDDLDYRTSWETFRLELVIYATEDLKVVLGRVPLSDVSEEGTIEVSVDRIMLTDDIYVLQCVEPLVGRREPLVIASISIRITGGVPTFE